MSNSSFNQSQSPYAQETNAGLVKKATAAQAAAKQDDDAGVPLYLPPSRGGDTLLNAEAGEALVQGQPVIIGDGLDSSSLVLYNSGTDIQDFTGGARWFAQRFSVPVGVTITSVAVRYNWVQGASATIAIRNTLTGPDLCTGTVSMNSSNGAVILRGLGMSPSLNIVEGQDYYIIFRTTSGSINTAGSTNNGYSGGEAFRSTDSGATWGAAPFVDMYFEVTGVRTVAGKVYLATENVRLQFAGWVQANAVKGATVQVNTQNYLVGLFTGLTVGQKYYFSATPGAMATSGTYLLGIAPTATDLVRLT